MGLSQGDETHPLKKVRKTDTDITEATKPVITSVIRGISVSKSNLQAAQPPRYSVHCHSHHYFHPGFVAAAVIVVVVA